MKPGRSLKLPSTLSGRRPGRGRPKGITDFKRSGRCVFGSLRFFLLILVLSLPGSALSAPPDKDSPSVYITGDALNVRALTGEETVLDLQGNVRFLERTRGIFASGRSGNWRKLVSRLRLSGSTAVFRQGDWIYGPLGLIDTEAERMTFPEGVLLVSGERTIAANRATFHMPDKEDEGEEGERVQFRGEVMVIDSSVAIFADSLDAFSDRDEAVARGDVVIDLYRDYYKITGSQAVFDSTSIVVTGEPTLEEFDSLGARIGLLEGDTIVIYPDEKRVEARGSSAADYKDVISEAGQTVMEGDGRTIVLLGRPKLDHEGETLEGETMHIRFDEEGEEIERMTVRGDARLVSARDDSLIHEQSIANGDSIVLHFRDGKLHETEVIGNAVSDRNRIDRRKDEHETSHAQGDTIRFIVEGNNLKEVHVAGTASGTSVTVPTDADEETVNRETVQYNADRIIYWVDLNRLALSGSAHVTKNTTELDAEYIRYDMDRDLLTALGEPSLKEAGDQVDGKRMVYNVKAGKGMIYDGVTEYESGFCRGERILRVGDDVLLLDHGRYTSCDLEEPHYFIAARQMKIQLEDKSIVRPVVLYIANIPVVAFPFYIFPMKGNRSSGFILPQIEFGFSEDKGRFLRNGGYFWAINDYTDLTFSGDFYENSHWIGRLDSRYRIRYLLNGSVRTSYQKSQNGRRRWSVNATHNQELGESMDLTMRANFVSDATYRVEQSTTLQDLNRQLKSDLTLKKRWQSRSFTMDLKRTEQLDTDKITESLPSITFRQNQAEIFPPSDDPRGGEQERRWYNDIYYRYSSRLLNSRKKADGEWEKNFGWNHDLGFTFSQKLRGWLALTTRADWKETWYDKDEIGQKWVRRGMGNLSASANTNVYGTWFPRLGPLVGLRHIITPSASFSYTPKNPNHFYDNPESGQEIDRFNSTFGRSQTRRRSVSLGISNKLQTKFQKGEEVVRNDQLFLINNRISHNFEAEDEPWSDLSSSLRFQPIRVFSSDLNLVHDVYSWENINQSVNSNLRLRGNLGSSTRPPSTDERELEGEPGEEPWDDEYGDERNDGYPEDSYNEDPLNPSQRGQQSRGTERSSSDLIPWNLSLGHKFSRSGSSSNFQQWLNSRLSLGLTKNWDLEYDNRYDLEEKEITSQSFRILRNLHCWEASFRGRYYGREWEYYFNIRVKAHREIFYEKGERRLGGF